MNIYLNTNYKNKCDYVIENGYFNGKNIDLKHYFVGFGVENGKSISIDVQGITDDEFRKIITKLAINIKHRGNSNKICLYVENTTYTKQEIEKLIKNIEWELFYER